jgi:hypothetical protein
MSDIRNILEARFPGLYSNIKKVLVEAEAKYNEKAGQAPSEFLLAACRTQGFKFLTDFEVA